MSRIYAITTIYGFGLDLLPHWCRYYTGLGVDQLLIVAGFLHDQNFLHGKNFRDNILPQIIDIARQFPAVVFPFTFDEYHTIYTQTVRENVKIVAGVRQDDWVIHTDLDEFYEFPVPLRDLIHVMEKANDWALHGHILDRVTTDGSLAAVSPDHNIGEQFPVGCLITRRILNANTRKIMLCRGRVRVNAPHDNTFNGRWSRVPVGTLHQYVVHHFKWTNNVMKKLEERLHGKGIGQPYREEIHRFLDYWYTHGRINVSDPRIEPRYCGPLIPR